MPEKEKVPVWLTALVDQRLALMKEHIGADVVIETTVVMTPLTEPRPFATRAEMERWERTCDRCGLYCPGDFYTGALTRNEFGTQVIFTYGVCPEHAKEFADG